MIEKKKRRIWKIREIKQKPRENTQRKDIGVI